MALIMDLLSAAAYAFSLKSMTELRQRAQRNSRQLA